MNFDYHTLKQEYLAGNLDLTYVKHVMMDELALLPLLINEVSVEDLDRCLGQLSLVENEKEFLLWEETLPQVILR